MLVTLKFGPSIVSDGRYEWLRSRNVNPMLVNLRVSMQQCHAYPFLRKCHRLQGEIWKIQKQVFYEIMQDLSRFYIIYSLDEDVNQSMGSTLIYANHKLGWDLKLSSDPG